MNYRPHLAGRVRLLLLGSTAVFPFQAFAQPMTAAPSSSVASAAVAGAGLVPVLLQRAQYWYDQGRYDRAQEALNQARQIAPDDPALLGLSGQWAIQRGDMGEARRIAASLHAVTPDAAETRRLEQALQHQAAPDSALSSIRALARAGRTVAAAHGYRNLFPDGPPPQYAVEYYQTLSGAVGYREKGREGLKALIVANPNDIAAQIAYAEVLTWQPTSRQDGLSRLERLAAVPGLPQDSQDAVRKSWRAALRWLPIVPESVPSLDAWLKVKPDDAEIKALSQRAQGAESEQAVLERTQAYEDLSNNDIAGAGEHFSNALEKAPNDGDALGGLGLVRMHQGRLDEARDLLKRAIQADPASASKWQDSLNATQASAAYGQVSRLMGQGSYDAALQQIEATLKLDPSQIGLVALRGEIERRRGHTTQAEAAYRQVLRSQPDNIIAVQGLYQLLHASGRAEEAETLTARLRRLSPSFERRMAGADLLAKAERTDNLDERISLLRQGMEDQRDDPWLRLRLAQALVQAGQNAEAHDVMAPLLSPAHKATIAELQAGIYFANEAKDFSTVRVLLGRLPDAGRTADIRHIAERAELRRLVDDAPDGPEARYYFMQIARRGHDPNGEWGQMIADALLDRGDRADAGAILQAFLDSSTPPMPRQRITYAGLFMRMQETDQARHVLEGIRPGSLSANEETALRGVETGLAIMTADRLNAQGRLADAYDVLKPVLKGDQPNSAARLALARLYQSDNQPKTALAIAKAVVARYPDDLDARLAVVRLALQNQNLDEAENQLRAMTAQASADSRIWLASAAIHRAGGNWTASISDLSRARDLRLQQIGGLPRRQGDILIDGAAADTNPFRKTTGEEEGAAGTQDPILDGIDREIASTTQEFAPFVDIGPVYQGRSGSGLNRLTEGDLPISGSLPLGPGRLSASVTPTVLSSGAGAGASAGVNDVDYLATLRGHDSGPLPAASAGHFQAVGVGIDLAYQWKWLKVDAGSTPLGFREVSPVGGVEFSPQITSQMRIRVTAERRALTDSLLAYAGLHDATTGTNWGGVMRNHAHAQFEYGDQLLNFYAGGGFAYIQGHHVQDNEEYEAGGGGSVSIFKDDVHEVRLGVDMTWFRYNNNQYLFTLGNGGYFSPESYYALLVPLRYSGHADRWTWNVGGSAGFQSYSSRAPQFYPIDPVWGHKELTGGQGGLPLIGLSGVSSSGLVGGANGHVTYQVVPGLRLSGDFQYQKAGPWNETTAGLSLHYSFLGTR